MNSMLWRPTLGGIDSKIEPKCCLSFRITLPPSHMYGSALYRCNTRTTRTSTCGTRTSPLLSPRHTLPTHFSAHHDSRCHSSLLSLSFPPPTPCTRILILNRILLPTFLPFQLLSRSLISFPHPVPSCYQSICKHQSGSQQCSVHLWGQRPLTLMKKCHRLF